MKYAIGFVVLCLFLAGCSEKEIVVVRVPAEQPPVAKAVMVETVQVTEEKPAPCHTIIGDTLKFTVLILSDVVGIFVPVEEKRKEILRTRLVEGW